MSIPNGTYLKFQSEAPVLSKFTAGFKNQIILVYSMVSPRGLRIKAYGSDSIRTLRLCKANQVSGFVLDDQLYIYYTMDNLTMRLMVLSDLITTPKLYSVSTGSDRPLDFNVAKIGLHFYMVLTLTTGQVLLKSTEMTFQNPKIFEPVTTGVFTYTRPVLGYEPYMLVDNSLTEILIGSEKVGSDELVSFCTVDVRNYDL